MPALACVRPRARAVNLWANVGSSGGKFQKQDSNNRQMWAIRVNVSVFPMVRPYICAKICVFPMVRPAKCAQMCHKYACFRWFVQLNSGVKMSTGLQ